LQQEVQQRRFERVFLILFLVTLPLINPWVRGDGVGYYAYARAILIGHNLDFTYDYQSANESFRKARCYDNGEPRELFRTVTGHLDNHFTVGPAMLWAPFLLVAHGGVLVARSLGSPVLADGYSAPYRIAMALATCLYGFLGLMISFRLACKYVNPRWAFLATLAIWGGSSLPVYMYFNPAWSHAHAAFISALFLWYWDKTRESRTWGQWLWLGLIVGMMLNVYYLNVVILTVLVVEALSQYAQVLQGKSAAPNVSFKQLVARHLVFGLIVIVVMIPTFASRWIVYGGPLRTGYLSLREFLWDSPVLFSVLFSANHGLLSWTPVLVLSILGLFLFAMWTPKPGVAFFLTFVAYYLFMAFYPDWAGISSFGNRYFIPMTPLFLFGLAAFLHSLAQRIGDLKVATAAISSVLLVFVLWNLGLMYQWGTHLVPPHGPISFRQAAANQFTVVPRQLATHLETYLFRRKDMMRQIEEHEMQRLNKDAEP